VSRLLLVDLQDAALGISNATTGDTLHLEAADGSLRTVTVAGSGRALAFDQDTRTDVLVL